MIDLARVTRTGFVCALTGAFAVMMGCAPDLHGDTVSDQVNADGTKPVIDDYAPYSPDRPDEPVTSESGIVGGTSAAPGAYPWIVNSGGCDGTLVGPRWVLTAAHCSSEYPIGGWVNIGGYRRSQMSSGSGEWRQISAKSCHPSRVSGSNDYDACVVQLAQPSTVAPLVIDRSTSSQAGVTAHVAGWGTTAQGGSQPDVLRDAAVPVLDQATCRQAYGSAAISDRMMCAGYLQGGIDSCQGDSGGPLVSDATGTLIGIVSWGYGCAQSGYPGIYTRVNAVDDWVCSISNNEISGCTSTSQQPPASSPPASTPPTSTTPATNTASCGVPNPSWLGDGYCDGGAYNTEACGFDAGDCCPSTCTPGQYQCGSNGYQCAQPAAQGTCSAPQPSWLGDGYCDKDPAYNNAECGFDGGDCCASTCQPGDYTCGANGYQCLDATQ